MEIAGPAVGQYDALDVSGLLQFAGGLNLTFVEGYIASAGDQLDLFDWGSTEGQFAVVNLPELYPALKWNTPDLYATGVISAGYVPEPGTFIIFGLGLIGLVVWRRRNTTN